MLFDEIYINRLIINFPNYEDQFAILKACSGPNGFMDFNSIVPMSQRLRVAALLPDSEWSEHLNQDILSKDAMQRIYDGDVPASKGEYEYWQLWAKNNRGAFGFPSWYTWRQRYWGSISNANCYLMTTQCYHLKNYEIQMIFGTRGHGCQRIPRKLSLMFPDAKFRIQYANHQKDTYDGIFINGAQVTETQGMRGRFEFTISFPCRQVSVDQFDKTYRSSELLKYEELLSKTYMENLHILNGQEHIII